MIYVALESLWGSLTPLEVVVLALEVVALVWLVTEKRGTQK